MREMLKERGGSLCVMDDRYCIDNGTRSFVAARTVIFINKCLFILFSVSNTSLVFDFQYSSLDIIFILFLMVSSVV